MAGESAGAVAFVKESRFLAGTLEHWRVGLRLSMSVLIRRVWELGRGQEPERQSWRIDKGAERDEEIRLNGNRDKRLENRMVEGNLVVMRERGKGTRCGGYE